MKITTQQIKQIINEELDKLLYEEETDSRLRAFFASLVSDYRVKRYDKKVKRQILALIDKKLNDKKNPIKDPDGVALLKNDTVREDPKLALEMLRTFYDKFEDDERETVEELADYPLNAGFEAKRNYLIDKKMAAKNLRGQDLEYADLSGLDLSGADLSYAFLIHTNLRGTDLRGANMNGTWLEEPQYNDQTQWPEGFDPEVEKTVKEKG